LTPAALWTARAVTVTNTVPQTHSSAMKDAA
jgi:hypothetical protein